MLIGPIEKSAFKFAKKFNVSIRGIENIPLDKTVITRAKIQIQFAGRDGKKGKSLTFEISSPNRCTLKDDPLDQIAKKYLEKWGFVSG